MIARRIREAIGYNSPAFAVAIEEDLEAAINLGKLTAADILAVVGAAEFARFQWLMSFHGTAGNCIILQEIA
jgi:hypothetical protein